MYQNEFGRSMMEMMGVLAVIGVLSVGGMYGYNSAINNYKVDKVVHVVSEGYVELMTSAATQSQADATVNRIKVPEGITLTFLDASSAQKNAYMQVNFGASYDLCQQFMNSFGNNSSEYTVISQCNKTAHSCVCVVPKDSRGKLIYNNRPTATDSSSLSCSCS